jgi:hypothetical protein
VIGEHSIDGDNEFLCYNKKQMHFGYFDTNFRTCLLRPLESMDALKICPILKYIGPIGCALLPALLNAAILWQLPFRNEFDSAQFAF